MLLAHSMDYIENSLVLSSELGDSGAHNPVQSMDDLRMTEKKQQAREISGVAPNCRISDAESTDCQKSAGSLIERGLLRRYQWL